MNGQCSSSTGNPIINNANGFIWTGGNEWQKMPVLQEDLNLDILGAGQSFRWSKDESDGSWTGVMHNTIWKLRQDNHFLYYQVLGRWTDNGVLSNDQAKLRDYFNLGIDIKPLYKHWLSSDVFFKDPSRNHPGVRILRQDPFECLLSFICSSNNNIKRITSMVNTLCVEYGQKLVGSDGRAYYNFPLLSALTAPSVSAAVLLTKLRNCQFGYRAPHIVSAVIALQAKGGVAFLHALRAAKTYAQAKQELMSFEGVGPKVADCVCLMSLDKPSAVPIDTHIWRVTTKNYLSQLLCHSASKTLTPKNYAEIGNFYRQKFGDYAGWATTVLFMEDLRQPRVRAARQPQSSSQSTKNHHNHNNNNGATSSSSDSEWDESITEAADLTRKEQQKQLLRAKGLLPAAADSSGAASKHKRRKF